jgi:beta-xylosidase
MLSHFIRNTGISFLLAGVLTASQAAYGQDTELEFTVDAASATIPLPKIFNPNIDLSGRGFHRDFTWPQELASAPVIDAWNKDIGFKGIYRIQYNLWEIGQLAKDKEAQKKLRDNYEGIIKQVSDAGGTVILDFFSTPPGLGKVLDKKSAPWDQKGFKDLVKNHMRYFSCAKKYTIWYEVWSAPDIDAFFLGRKQEYLQLYKAVAEAAKELGEEAKIKIPVGGPSSSWWFQYFEGNTIINPEGSLIYELIKFCYQSKLPLDFISWHAYSTDPKAEKETTLYSKAPVALMRDWLSYFNFPKATPIIVDEWNYDSGDNVLSERKEASFINASYVPARLKEMYEAGIDLQVFFSLEDFQGNKEGVKRNVGVFWYDPDAQNYKGGSKATYAVFRMLNKLGDSLFTSLVKASDDECVDVIATRSQDGIALLVYNYIDKFVFKNHISRNIALLNTAERETLVKMLKSDTSSKIMLKEIDLGSLGLTEKLTTIFRKAQDLNERATKYMFYARNIKLTLKNLKASYTLQRYVIDSSCSMNCELRPQEEREVNVQESVQLPLTLNPYSVHLILLKKKIKDAEVPAAPAAAEQLIEASVPAATAIPKDTQETNAPSPAQKQEKAPEKLQ